MDEHPVSHFVTRSGKVIKLKRITPARYRRAFKPYGEAIGYLAYTWNRLHESLCQIFVSLIDQRNQRMPAAIWYSSDSDYAQRKMLRAAVDTTDILNKDRKDAILWVLNKIDERLRHDRNDALHAPLSQTHGIVDDALKSWFEADIFSASPRAKSLSGKNLIDEFNKHATLALTLALYVDQMKLSIFAPTQFPWPEKPSLPHAHQKKSRKARSHQSKTK